MVAADMRWTRARRRADMGRLCPPWWLRAPGSWGHRPPGERPIQTGWRPAGRMANRRSAQVPVEPVEHPRHAVDPAIGPARGCICMRFLRVEDVLDLPAEVAQRDEQLLVVLGRA